MSGAQHIFTGRGGMNNAISNPNNIRLPIAFPSIINIASIRTESWSPESIINQASIRQLGASPPRTTHSLRERSSELITILSSQLETKAAREIKQIIVKIVIEI